MNKWRQVGYFADSIVYARGNTRKLVMPRRPDIYLELDTKKVWWHKNSRRGKPVTAGGDK